MRTHWMMGVMLLSAALLTDSARAQEARKPDGSPAATSVVRPVDPTDAEKRETARRLLQGGGNATQATARQDPSSTASGATGTSATNAALPSAQPVVTYIDPIAEAHAREIERQGRLQEEVIRRQMDRDDMLYRDQMAQQARDRELQEAIALDTIDRQRTWDEQQLAAGWHALETDAAQQYQNLMFQDQALAAGQIGLQSAVTANRGQYWALKSFRQWDNLNRSMTVVGGAFGDFSGLAAGGLNLVMHGHEDNIDRDFEEQFDAQQSGMLSDIDRTRAEQTEVRQEIRENLRLRMEALRARQGGLRQQQP